MLSSQHLEFVEDNYDELVVAFISEHPTEWHKFVIDNYEAQRDEILQRFVR